MTELGTLLVDLMKSFLFNFTLGIHGYEMFFDINGEVQYPFRLHHFGKRRK